MRVLLRDIDSGKYLALEGKWAPEAMIARDFGSTPAALQQALSSKRGPLEIVLSFDDPCYDIAMRVNNDRNMGN
jgi:hypothetical protein